MISFPFFDIEIEVRVYSSGFLSRETYTQPQGLFLIHLRTSSSHMKSFFLCPSPHNPKTKQKVQLNIKRKIEESVINTRKEAQ